MQATPKGSAVAWALLVVMGAANAAGYVLDLYHRFWWFDRALHPCTILAVTLWLALFVFGRTLNRERGDALVLILLVASVGIAIGALWEVAEWGFDQIAPGDVIKGKYDTIIDILLDTVGSVSAGILALKLSQPYGARIAAQP